VAYALRHQDIYKSDSVVDACWPFQWKDRAYAMAQVGAELRDKLLGQWSEDLKEVL
jgi:hypothetical protein